MRVDRCLLRGMAAFAAVLSPMSAYAQDNLEQTYARLCSTARTPSETCVALKKALIEKLGGSTNGQRTASPPPAAYAPPQTPNGIFDLLVAKGTWKTFDLLGRVNVVRWTNEGSSKFISDNSTPELPDLKSYYTVTGPNTAQSCISGAIAADTKKQICRNATFTQTSLTIHYPEGYSSVTTALSPDAMLLESGSHGVKVKYATFSAQSFDNNPQIRELALQTMRQAAPRAAEQQKRFNAELEESRTEAEAKYSKTEEEKSAKAKKDWQPLLDALGVPQ